MANYDSSQVGVPYIRVGSFHVDYGKDGKVGVIAQQELAVKLADSTIATLQSLPSVMFEVDMLTQGGDKSPLVHPTTGASLGKDVTNNEVMLSILAALRVKQLQQNT